MVNNYWLFVFISCAADFMRARPLNFVKERFFSSLNHSVKLSTQEHYHFNNKVLLMKK